jgi:hypothetical protein
VRSRWLSSMRQRALLGLPEVPYHGEPPVVAGRGCQGPHKPQAQGRRCAVSEAAISRIATPTLTTAATSVLREAPHGSTPLSCPGLASALLQPPSLQGTPNDPTLSCAACPAPVQGVRANTRMRCSPPGCRLPRWSPTRGRIPSAALSSSGSFGTGGQPCRLSVLPCKLVTWRRRI